MVSSWRTLLRTCAQILRTDGARALAARRQLIYHRGTGLNEVRKKYAIWGAERVAHEVMARCRSRLCYWSKLAERQSRREAQTMLDQIREAERSVEGAPQIAMERIRRALRKRKCQGGNIAMQRVFRHDDKTQPTVSSPLEVPRAMQDIGSGQQDRFRDEGCCVSAFQAFSDCFCAQWPTMRMEEDETTWSLDKALTFPMFLATLQRMRRRKAVGADGLGVDMCFWRRGYR